MDKVKAIMQEKGSTASEDDFLKEKAMVDLVY
jgi:hypothetical protein